MFKKIVKKFLITSAICISFNSFVASANDSNDIDYYEDEGRLLFKARIHGLSSNGKQTGFSATKNQISNPEKVGRLIQNGYGGDVATTIFFNDNIASELSLGFSVLKVKHSSLKNVGINYNANTDNLGKKKGLYAIPLTFTGQYHIAPFGAIRPYIGLGYHGAYIVNKCKGFNVKNGHGFVAQAGVDFVAKDDTIINLDIKQYLLNTKVQYKESFIKPPVTSKIKINPLLISVGIGFKF
jgi:outer membrane protein